MFCFCLLDYAWLGRDQSATFASVYTYERLKFCSSNVLCDAASECQCAVDAFPVWLCFNRCKQCLYVHSIFLLLYDAFLGTEISRAFVMCVLWQRMALLFARLLNYCSFRFPGSNDLGTLWRYDWCLSVSQSTRINELVLYIDSFFSCIAAFRSSKI